MRNQLFTDNQFEQMSREVRRLLKEVGFRVDHDAVREMALKAGCRLSVKGRILFSDVQIDELAARLRGQHDGSLANDKEHQLVRQHGKTVAFFGNIAPKYFNYAAGAEESGCAGNLTELLKYAQGDPRIVSITIPVSRGDVAPEIEQIDSILRMAKLTDKTLGAVDITTPEEVPYFEEIAGILGLTPGEFISPCNCINPPMHLGCRTAETMLLRKRYHGMSMITPMPSLGATGPVDVYGSVVLGTAEIVGGLILSSIIDPEAPLLGYIAAGQLDMRTAANTQSSPQSIRLDAGVYQLMEKCFGGGTKVGGRTYVSAKRPGLQAVFEKTMKMVGYSAYVDANAFFYGGGGVLNNGGTISPEQFLLDLEVSEALEWLWATPEVPAENDDAFARIRDEILATGGNFLTSGHTLDHYRDDLWVPRYFTNTAEAKSEADIMGKCHADYTNGVRTYKAASHPEEQIAQIERILSKVKERYCV